MKRFQQLKGKLSRNELTIGTWLTIPDIAVAEIMARSGFEWIAVDIEHTCIDYKSLLTLIAVIQGQDIPALVRVGANDELIIKRVLDSGANGIIVPRVDTKQLAEQAVAFTHYPPMGRRGVGLYRAQDYGYGFEEYKNIHQNDLVIIAQIEHISGVNQIESITEVPGIDACLIGPYDLSASMGYPGNYDRDDVKSAIAKVFKVCKDKRKPVGFHVIETNPARMKQRIGEGCTFLAYSLDFFFLADKIKESLGALEGT